MIHFSSIFYLGRIGAISFIVISLMSASAPVFAQGHPRDFIQSTSPLKSGGTITTVTSQGNKRSWVNQTPASVSRQRETGYNEDFSSTSRSFYRQSQGGSYPYPGGSVASQNAGSRFANDQQAQLRYERAGGDRSTGEIGRANDAGQSQMPNQQGPTAQRPSRQASTQPIDSRRTGQSQRPPERLAQVPGADGSTVPLPGANLPSPSVAMPNTIAAGSNTAAGGNNCNCGPNYVNPYQNYLAGYQGYQAGAVAANSVPALNTQAAARVAQANCCVPQPYQPYGNQAAANQVPQLPNPAYQFQPNIGVPQLGGGAGTNRSGLSSLLTGSGQYTPLFQFRNMPPGTYLGQGLIGQPTAYVDGQPFRNLLRYISP